MKASADGRKLKVLLTVAIPTVTVLVGILVNNRQLEQLDRHINQQITSLRNEMIARLERVEGVLDARLKQVEETLRLR
jgi:hypothetical protein